MPSDDGLFAPYIDSGVLFPNGMTGTTVGAHLTWRLPIEGLSVGAAVNREIGSGKVSIPTAGLTGTTSFTLVEPQFFAKYEIKKMMIAGEYNRVPGATTMDLIGAPKSKAPYDKRRWYAMSTYKARENVTVGMYYSSFIDLQAPMTNARYQKDWALSARLDINPAIYLKAEQHFIDGTAQGYLMSNNTNLRPDSRLTILKIGAIF